MAMHKDVANLEREIVWTIRNQQYNVGYAKFEIYSIYKG